MIIEISERFEYINEEELWSERLWNNYIKMEESIANELK